MKDRKANQVAGKAKLAVFSTQERCGLPLLLLVLLLRGGRRAWHYKAGMVLLGYLRPAASAGVARRHAVHQTASAA